MLHGKSRRTESSLMRPYAPHDRRDSLRAFCLLILLECVWSTSTGRAQPQLLAPRSETNFAASSADPEITTKTVEARLAEARNNLSDPPLTNAPAGISTQDIWTRRALQGRLVRLYEQQLSAAAVLESAKTRRGEAV